MGEKGGEKGLGKGRKVRREKGEEGGKGGRDIWRVEAFPPIHSNFMWEKGEEERDYEKGKKGKREKGEMGVGWEGR